MTRTLLVLDTDGDLRCDLERLEEVFFSLGRSINDPDPGRWTPPLAIVNGAHAAGELAAALRAAEDHPWEGRQHDTLIVVVHPEAEGVDITERMLGWAATGPPSRADDVSVVFHGETGRRASTEDLKKLIAQVEDDIANGVDERDWKAWAIEMRRHSN